MTSFQRGSAACCANGLLMLRSDCSDKALLTSSDAVGGMGPSYLQSREGLFRSLTTQVDIIIDFGEACCIDTIALGKTNLSDGASIRVQGSDTMFGLTTPIVPGLIPPDCVPWPIILGPATQTDLVPLDGLEFDDEDLCPPITDCASYNALIEAWPPNAPNWPYANLTPIVPCEGGSFDGVNYFDSGNIDAFCTQESHCGSHCPDDEDCSPRDWFWHLGDRHDCQRVGEDRPCLRFWRVRIDDPNNLDGFLEIRRLFAGQAQRFTCQLAKGWGVQVIDEASHQRTLSGTSVCGCGPRYRRFTGALENGDQQILNAWQAPATKRGKCQDLFLSVDPSDPCNREHWSFWVEPSQFNPVTSPRCGRYSTALTLDEVL